MHMRQKNFDKKLHPTTPPRGSALNVKFRHGRIKSVLTLVFNVIVGLAGSDWRDIPNKKTFLPSGQIIQPLLFPYEKSYFNEKTKKKERVSSLLRLGYAIKPNPSHWNITENYLIRISGYVST